MVRPRDVSWEYPHPFGHLFGIISFRNFLEEKVLVVVVRFGCNFEPPSAFHGGGSLAIHARVCSRNALSDCLIVHENSSQEIYLGAPFRLPFSFKFSTSRVFEYAV